MNHNPMYQKQYNPDKFENKIKRIECSPTILDGQTLMSEDSDFMNKDKIEAECRCKKKDTCKAIVNLLLNWKLKEATSLL